MAVELSKNVLEVFAGRKRARVAPTLVIATVVTLLIGVPLWFQASDASAKVVAGQADRIIVIDMPDGAPGPLDQTVISGRVLISYNDPNVEAVSWRIVRSGESEPVFEGQDREGPQFDLNLSDGGFVETLDSNLLGNGQFELFVAVASDAGEQRTAVSFEVANTP